MGDELIETETSEKLTREQAAARLRAIADSLSRHNELRFQLGEHELAVAVPDQVTLEVEFDVEGEETELGISLSW